MPISHFNVGGGCVDVPVGASISDHESFKVGFEVRSLSGFIVGVDLVNDVGHVNAGVRLSRDIEVVSLELWEESLEEIQDSIQVVH